MDGRRSVYQSSSQNAPSATNFTGNLPPAPHMSNAGMFPPPSSQAHARNIPPYPSRGATPHPRLVGAENLWTPRPGAQPSGIPPPHAPPPQYFTGFPAPYGYGSLSSMHDVMLHNELMALRMRLMNFVGGYYMYPPPMPYSSMGGLAFSTAALIPTPTPTPAPPNGTFQHPDPSRPALDVSRPSNDPICHPSVRPNVIKMEPTARPSTFGATPVRAVQDVIGHTGPGSNHSNRDQDDVGLLPVPLHSIKTEAVEKEEYTEQSEAMDFVKSDSQVAEDRKPLFSVVSVALGEAEVQEAESTREPSRIEATEAELPTHVADAELGQTGETVSQEAEAVAQWTGEAESVEPEAVSVEQGVNEEAEREPITRGSVSAAPSDQDAPVQETDENMNKYDRLKINPRKRQRCRQVSPNRGSTSGEKQKVRRKVTSPHDARHQKTVGRWKIYYTGGVDGDPSGNSFIWALKHEADVLISVGDVVRVNVECFGQSYAKVQGFVYPMSESEDGRQEGDDNEDEDELKVRIQWYYTEEQMHSTVFRKFPGVKAGKREIFLTPHTQWLSVTAIDGKVRVVSLEEFESRWCAKNKGALFTPEVEDSVSEDEDELKLFYVRYLYDHGNATLEKLPR